MYQVCRVQKLESRELFQFDEHFIDHLLEMVETTRNQQDESLNYAVIKLILALNEQFMVATLPRKEKEKSSSHPVPGSAPMPAPSKLPDTCHPKPPSQSQSSQPHHERQRSGSLSVDAYSRNHARARTGDAGGVNGKDQTEEAKKANRVLMVLMRRLGSSKTFGENIIFMLNRARE